MSDIQYKLQDFRRMQKASHSLIPVRFDVYLAAKTRLLELRDLLSSTSLYELDNARLEADNIKAAVDEIREIRADIIWTAAWSGEEREDNMLQYEKPLYLEAVEIAGKLRGIP